MKKRTVFVLVGAVCALAAMYLANASPGYVLTPSSTPLVIAAFVCFWLANKDAKKARGETERRRVRRQ